MDNSESKENVLDDILKDIDKMKDEKEWSSGRYIPGLGNYLKSRRWEANSHQSKPIILDINHSKPSQIDEINSLIG
jgi:hypothetical protein